MPVCYKCGRETSRRRRTLLRKIVSRASFHCNHCGTNSNFYRPLIAAFQFRSQCPLCHNRILVKRSKLDRVDRVSANPLRRVLGLFGFPLYHCTFCRYQFRDFRPRAPEASRHP